MGVLVAVRARVGGGDFLATRNQFQGQGFTIFLGIVDFG